MDESPHYFDSIAKKLSDLCEKPLTILSAMAFLFIMIVAIAAVNIPIVAKLIGAAIVTMINLLLVLTLQNAHRQDIRSLQAKLDEFAGRQDTDKLADDVRPVADIDDEDPAEALRRSNRDKRPSLF